MLLVDDDVEVGTESCDKNKGHGQVCWFGYPLVNIQKAIENCHL